VEILQKTTTFRRLDLPPSSGGWSEVDLISRAHQKHLVWISGQTPIRRKQLLNTRQPVSSVGDRNKITIKNMIEICAKHAHVKNVKKRKYELDAANQTQNQLTWHVQPIRSANPAWIFLPYEFPSSMKRLTS
jgi:hypothetical protein